MLAGFLNVVGQRYWAYSDSGSLLTSVANPAYCLNNRGEASLIALGNDKLLLIGGSGAGGLQTAVEEYNLATNSWTAKAPLPASNFHPGAGMAANLGNGKILCSYAIDTSTSGAFLFKLYDIATNTWSNAAPLTTPETGAIAPNNLLTVAVGKAIVTGVTQGPTNSATSHIYDFATNTWATIATPPGRAWQSLAIGTTGVVFALFGTFNAPGLARYNFSSNTWTTLSSSIPPAGVSVFGQLNSDELVVVTFQTGNPVATETWIYTISTNVWRLHHVMQGQPAGYSAALAPGANSGNTTAMLQNGMMAHIGAPGVPVPGTPNQNVLWLFKPDYPNF